MIKFKKNAEPIHTSDFWYDLTTGGYIKPEKFLEKESVKKVKEAIKLIKEFEEKMYEEDLIIEL